MGGRNQGPVQELLSAAVSDDDEDTSQGSQMNERDIKAVILWFKERIKALEISEHYGRIREGVNRLVGFVEVLEGELDGQSH